MPDLETMLSQLEADLAVAKVRKEYQKGRLKIIRSYKGDTSRCESVLTITRAQIDAMKAERRKLIERICVRPKMKKPVEPAKLVAN